MYEAIDARTGEHVAVKELDNTSPDSIARFKHEFRVLAGFHHGNLVTLKELIEHNGRWLIIMELVPGTDFLSYVRASDNDNGFDEGRLRAALSGMLEGLSALHGQGVLHRDLKPSNVRVRPDGRAVLLDFGLATSADPRGQSTHVVPVGTAAYMAPEQAAGRDIGTAADLYALGVCLFEALTGRLPFPGPQALTMLIEKQQRPAPNASSFCAVPADLDVLCTKLLAIDPADRPTADAVLDVLQGTRARSAADAAPAPDRAAKPELFAGREGELAVLERALARTHQGELRIVLIEGESGVGKSELALEFVRRMQGTHADMVALRGRCYENEQVSYKALDGCVDDLARVLGHLDERTCSALLPLRAGLLGQLFPVLRQVRAIARAKSEGSSADPTARRLEAFAAFCALLAKFAEERTVVLVVDDLQWADAESFRLLSGMIEHSPPPPVLLLATVRPRSELEPDVLAHVEQVRARSQTDVLPVVGLPREQAQKLARALLGPDTPARWLDMIADESQGHPLFMSELVQYTRSHDLGAHINLTLDAALRARIDRLDRRARELLEMVAIAARPYSRAVFSRALGGADLEQPARALLSAKLLRERRGHELGCFHDRIRHAVVTLIAQARIPVLHRKMGAALASFPDTEPAEQALHWDLAGEREHAVSAYEQAATRASEALAFRRAAQLAARALELLEDPRSEHAQRLMSQRADALNCAGYTSDAARLFLQAAENANGERRLRLRASAARALLISADVARGFATARDLLRELGISVPRHLLGIVARYAWDSLVLRLRQPVFERRATAAPSPSARERLGLELLSELALGMITAHPLLWLAVNSQRARLALRVGSRDEAALMYAERGWLSAVTHSLSTALPFFEKSRALLDGSENLEARATRAFVEGSGRIAGFDWAGARAHLEEANTLCQQNLPNRPWLLTSVRYMLGILWFESREFAHLASEMESWIIEAHERNDAYAVALLSGHGRGFARHLMRDDPRAAHSELDEAFARVSSAPFSFAHLGYLIAKLTTYLYEGSSEALPFLESFEREHRHALLLRGRAGREVCTMFRGFALVRALDRADAEQARALRKRLRPLRSSLARAHTAVARGVGLSLTSQIAALDGRRDRAIELARRAVRLIDGETESAPSSHSAVLGLIEGGAAGRARYEAAVRHYQQQGFRDPVRALSIYAGALSLLQKGAKAPARALLLGRYEVTDQLGAGGFGAVVSAREVKTGRVVALKELVRSGGSSLERFKREYRALSELHHTNIVQLEALFAHEGRWYIAMERIEGSELLAYVRESGACDLDRLRTSFAGVARALRALHDRQLVHRDVGPSNVLVRPDGRAVLIDFGLLARRDDPSDKGGVGSPEYAAPEQLRGAPPDPSADVYALGVCLAQAITGEYPFGGGAPHEIIARKERGLLALPEVPRELRSMAVLAERMLALDPRARPLLDEVLYALESATLSSPSLAPAEPEPEAAFVGRDDELAQLEDAFERTCDEGLTVALIRGESGLGKSALARRFAESCALRTPALWVLESRCYQNEQIPGKAFDGAVDQIARRLRALPNPACEAILPKHAALLGQLFPVLTSVPAIAKASTKGVPIDPVVRKGAARSCFVELLVNLCKRTELLLIVDDLQWADPDSFELVRSLVTRAESLPFLIVATLRPEEDVVPELREPIGWLRALPSTRQLDLAPLSRDDSARLAARWLGERAGVAEDLATESAGHPLFLRELIEHARRRIAGEASPRSLDAALSSRVQALEVDSRRLLSLVALGDKPYGSHVYARALGRDELPREALIALLGQGLVRRSADGSLACSHDRIRRAALGLLASEALRDDAGQLAEALQREPGSDPAERARLWELAGALSAAVDAYEQAGERALEALAFTAAEQHFARALSLLGDTRDERQRSLLTARGHALVRAGRSAQAARAFQAAAETAEGEQKVRLRIWVAQQLIQSAQVVEGIRAGSELLAELGISLPRSERAALARIAWERARVRLRPRRREEPRALSTREQLTLEALHGLAAPLSFASYLTGSTVMAQYLSRAIDAGEPEHAARALALEGLWRSLRAGERDDALFERARELAARVSDPGLDAHIAYLRGLACLTRTEYREGLGLLNGAHEIVTARCPGHPWLLNGIRTQIGFASWTLGDLRAIRRHSEGWLAEARERDDRSAIAALVGQGGACLRHLFEDDSSAALAEIEEAMAPWPEEPFTAIHFGTFSVRALIYPTRPPGPEYAAWMEREAPRLARAFMMRAPGCRLTRLAMRCAALAQHVLSRSDPRLQTALPEMRAVLREISRSRAPIATHAHKWWEAVLAAAEGNQEEALRRFAQIRRDTERASLLGGLAADYAVGILEGGEAGRQRCAAVLAELTLEGWRNPMTGLRVRGTGLHLLG